MKNWEVFVVKVKGDSFIKEKEFEIFEESSYYYFLIILYTIGIPYLYLSSKLLR